MSTEKVVVKKRNEMETRHFLLSEGTEIISIRHYVLSDKNGNVTLE